MKNLEHLFSPITIGGMHVRNRLVMSAMTTNYGSEKFEITERLIRYHEARAAGGVGLITLEMCSIDSSQRYQPQSLSLGEDRFIEKHRELVERVHRLGACIQPQISHPGPESMTDPVGPSVNVNAGTGWPSRVLEHDEMQRVIVQYGDAAVRAKEAGYDGMELHAAHAYMLLGSFLCPARNRREDEYTGATLEGRTRLLLEVIRHIKSRTGPDFPITIRISGNEDAYDGRDVNDTQRIAPLLVEAGIDAIQVSGGVSHDKIVAQIVCGSHYPNGYNVGVASAIRKVVDVPVMVVGRIHDPEYGERILAEGQADMIVMARPLLADPELPNKARTGRLNEIRRCISCQNCIDSMLIAPFDANMNCAVNARTGREATLDMKPSAKRRHVVVIGGGTAGMEAARVAAIRGHRVSLFERGRRLGGSLFFAATVHEDNQRLLEYLLGQMQRLPIELNLGVDVDPGVLQACRPDAVIVATGARVDVPSIPGAALPHVFSGTLLRNLLAGLMSSEEAQRLPGLRRLIGTQLLPRVQPWLRPRHLRELSRAYLPFGRRVVVIGADLPAVELAEFIARRGRSVSILAGGAQIAPEVGPKRRHEHMLRLDRLKVEILSGIEVQAIEPDVVRFSYRGRGSLVAADTVLIAGEAVADLSLFERLRDDFEDVQAIGDCTGPGLIRKATEDAVRVACAL
jgi:2,4-dienoyl-CoA reductase (NADPH2)